jgi:hypothetical protein
MLCKWNNGYSDSASEHAQAFGSAELEKKKRAKYGSRVGKYSSITLRVACQIQQHSIFLPE